MTGHDFLQLFATVAASFLGAWLAARFALNRFYKEKVWERKVAAYTEIFNALHDVNKFYEEQWLAHTTQREIPEERFKELRERTRAANDTVKRRLDTEIWLVPEECAVPIARLERQLDESFETFGDLLDNHAVASRQAINELRVAVRKDLRLRDSLWTHLRRYVRTKYETWRWSRHGVNR